MQRATEWEEDLGVDPSGSRGLPLEEDSKIITPLLRGGRGGFCEEGRILGPWKLKETFRRFFGVIVTQFSVVPRLDYEEGVGLVEGPLRS